MDRIFRTVGAGLGTAVTIKVIDSSLGSLARINDNSIAKKRRKKKK